MITTRVKMTIFCHDASSRPELDEEPPEPSATMRKVRENAEMLAEHCAKTDTLVVGPLSTVHGIL